MLFEILVWVLHNLDMSHSYNFTMFIARFLHIFVLQKKKKKTVELIFKIKQKDIHKLTTRNTGLYVC
jgi:hypothetical protein